MAGKLTFESDLKGPLDYIKIKVMINADTKRWDFLSDFLHLPTTLFQLISNNKPPSLIETIQSELPKFGAIRQSMHIILII
jgi:hypothetical protein